VTRRRAAGSPEAEAGIDLLVPASVSPGKGRRAARLQGHDAHTARIVQGLEGALVDNDLMRLTSLEADGPRSFDILVAGAAALLVAKVHKIQDRRESSRLSDKDALDVLRLLRGTPTEDLAARYRRIPDDERSRDTALHAASLLRTQFADRRGVGVEMVLRAVGRLEDHETTALSSVALAGDLLAALE